MHIITVAAALLRFCWWQTSLDVGMIHHHSSSSPIAILLVANIIRCKHAHHHSKSNGFNMDTTHHIHHILKSNGFNMDTTHHIHHILKSNGFNMDTTLSHSPHSVNQWV
eukprot:TRINITY_DN33006_c0_g1_i4.p1 TRINITY_DN33006_c0_g1~~TRINITY_DN33006_c0_g1_i4.p1  ORF type:complete len:109 (+),score=11.93 TRINITY_DN33006_c0_g1_i4:34-360(+)